MRISRLFGPLAILVSLVCAMHSAHAADCSAIKSGKFKVKIDSAPQGAAVYINGKDCPAVGVTPYEGSLNAGDFSVTIEAPGYEPATRPFKIARLRKTQELFVPLAKKPQLEIRADADKNLIGASVSVDGQPVGVIQGPLVIPTTAARHLVEIKKDGFETLSQWIDMSNNPQQILTPSLGVGKPKFGTVIVDADVQGAEIYIDGNKHPDNTPAVINNVIEGIHVIEVKKSPSPAWKMTVSVVAGQQTKVHADLEAGMGKGVGVIRVLSDAQGARAYLDGTDMGPVPVDIKDVKAGDHIVQVKAPGFQTSERRVSVTAGGSKIEKFDLNAEAAGDRGTLKVVSTVPEAQVFIDGAAVGKVPQEKKLSAGEHPVVVRLDGFKQFEQKVRLDAGQTVTVTAELRAVGRLRIVSTPAKAQVIINGIPAGRTPLDTEVEVGETVVRTELAGFQPFEETVNIQGGKTETRLHKLLVAGPSEAELVALQRGLSSFGARAIPRGRSTVDLSVGYPYFFEGRVNVGAGRLGNLFGFDAGVGVRTMLARTELGLGGRTTFVDQDPFSAGAFTNIWWGSKLLDDSRRNGLTWDVGVMASLTAVAHVTITGRFYVDVWSDRHCPGLDPTQTTTDGFDGTPIAVCKQYKDGTLSDEEKRRVQKLTTGDPNKPWDFTGRENGARLMLSLIAELALQQQTNIFGIIEGAPYQGERALFTEDFAHSMFPTDYDIYVRMGISYKF
jgi:hypothetical protein